MGFCNREERRGSTLNTKGTIGIYRSRRGLVAKKLLGGETKARRDLATMVLTGFLLKASVVRG